MSIMSISILFCRTYANGTRIIKVAVPFQRQPYEYTIRLSTNTEVLSLFTIWEQRVPGWTWIKDATPDIKPINRNEIPDIIRVYKSDNSFSWKFDDSERIPDLECDTIRTPSELSFDDWKARVNANLPLLLNFQEDTLKFLNTEFLRKIIRTSAVDFNAYKQSVDALSSVAVASSSSSFSSAVNVNNPSSSSK